MAFRFRKSIKVGGVRVNVGKRGVSATVGPRGTSINIGKHGAYSNVGIPGTGITYRSKLGGNKSYQGTSNRATNSPSTHRETQIVELNFSVDDETGVTQFTDINGRPLSSELIAIAKKQNRGTIESMLESGSQKFNDRLDLLLRPHFETPPPDTKISYTPVPFTKPKPILPDDWNYKALYPTQPTPKDKSFFSKRIGFLGNRVEEENRKMQEVYQIALAKADLEQQELDQKLARDRQRYEKEIDRWQKEKDSFDQEQLRIQNFVNVERLTNVDAMQDFLEEHLDSLEWPLETNVSFDISTGGTQIWADIDLPEIEMMPVKTSKVNHNKLNLTISDIPKTHQQKNYLTHIHAIGFRLIGEIFVALPSSQEIILSGYSQRPSRKTGHIENEYLYSVRVQRDQWEKINFSGLIKLDVVECLQIFDMKRMINKFGLIMPIEPFKP